MTLLNSARNVANRALGVVGLKLERTNEDLNEKIRLHELRAKGYWDSKHCGHGLSLNDESFLGFLRDVVHPYQNNFSDFYRGVPADNNGFSAENAYFGGVDAEILYSLVRYGKPKAIVEIGSGNSTKLMRQAAFDEGLSTRIISIDPSPRFPIDAYADEHLPQMVEHLQVDEICSRLGPGDILFVDSSHVAKTGGDINFVILEILPQLAEGVLVHVHNMYIPYDYPLELLERFPIHWSEQYVLEAFLSFNPLFEIIWLSNYMWRDFREAVLAEIPRGATQAPPTSLWMRKVSTSASRPAGSDLR